jgi:hypothetical protein
MVSMFSLFFFTFDFCCADGNDSSMLDNLITDFSNTGCTNNASNSITFSSDIESTSDLLNESAIVECSDDCKSVPEDLPDLRYTENNSTQGRRGNKHITLVLDLDGKLTTKLYYFTTFMLYLFGYLTIHTS